MLTERSRLGTTVLLLAATALGSCSSGGGPAETPDGGLQSGGSSASSGGAATNAGGPSKGSGGGAANLSRGGTPTGNGGGANEAGGEANAMGGAATGAGGISSSNAGAAGTSSGGSSTGSGGTGGTSGAGGVSAGGAGGKGGTAGGGGMASGGAGGKGGSGGTGGPTVPRPTYNTGTGFYVVGSKLYDAKGVEFRIRGVNKLHWDADSPGIPKTHANTERWDIDFNQTTAKNISLMQQSLDNHIVPIPGNWKGTCDESADTLTGIVDTWVAQASAWKAMNPYMILNVANEWGPSSTVWRDSYVDAVKRLRAAGYLCTISVTSGGCGQDNGDLANYAAAVFASDPQKNVIFDQHIYGGWASGGGQSGQTDLKTGLDKLVATGLPMLVGEFGPGRNIGPSATNMTPGEIIQAAEARGIGWLAWAWDDPASNADDTWFALSKNGKYDSSADLTTFGKEVVENQTYGLLVLAKPATTF